MGSTLALLLALGVANTATEQQPGADKKLAAKAAGTEQSLVTTAITGISALANNMTPIQPATHDDKIADSTPAAVVWVRMSKKYLADYVERNVDHNKPARENVLGIIFTGQSHTAGKTRLVLHPNNDRATAEVEFSGTVHSQTVGHSGPATLQYVSESSFRARKSLVVGESGITTATASVDAPTRLTPTSIATSLPGLRGRIGDRIARRREAASRTQAEAIVGRDTANDIRHDFNAKLDAAIANIQNEVRDQIAALRLNGKGGTVTMRSRSTADFVEVAICSQRPDATVLDMALRSPFNGNPEFSVYVHKSLIPSLLANTELREKLAPMFAGAAPRSESSERLTTRPMLSMNGSWIALDLADGGQPVRTPSRVAATQSLTSR